MVSEEKDKKSNRFMELEGLRGLAAIVVVVYHAMIMYYPGIAYGHNANLAPVQNMRFEDNLYGNPLNVFLSGGFAVAIFFVLSGFVLSIGFFQTGKQSIIQRLASKRYLRLMLPALMSTLFVFILVVLDLSINRQATINITHSGSLATDWNFVPSFLEAMKQGTTSIFLQSGGSYNAVLWTMYYEFIGSFIVFITLLVFGLSRYRWIIYIGLLWMTLGMWFFGIILGMVLADIYAHRSQIFLTGRRIWAWFALGGGLLLGGYPILSTKGTFYEPFTISRYTEDQNAALYMSLGAVLVVVAVLGLSPLSKLFRHPKISFLGRYTYSLYLTHTLVLYTLGTTLFVLLAHHFGLNKSAVFATIMCLPAIALVTWLFEKYIDAPSIRFANFFSDIVLGRRELDERIIKRIGRIKVRALSTIMYFREAWKVRRRNIEREDDEF